MSACCHCFQYSPRDPEVVAEKIQHAEEDLALVAATFLKSYILSLKCLIIHWLGFPKERVDILWNKRE